MEMIKILSGDDVALLRAMSEPERSKYISNSSNGELMKLFEFQKKFNDGDIPEGSFITVWPPLNYKK